MKKTLETSDVTIAGLEAFLREARNEGGQDEDVCKLVPYAPHPHGSLPPRPAKVMVELRVGLWRRGWRR